MKRLEDRTLADLEARLRFRESAVEFAQQAGDAGYLKWCREFAEEARRDVEQRRAVKVS